MLKTTSSLIQKFQRWFKRVLTDNAKQSLITIDESTAIKGILMLLIILGHNKYMMQGGYSNRFLYSFHVYCFFLLPFLYDWHDYSLKKQIVKLLKRLYIPYTIAFVGLIALTRLSGDNLVPRKIVEAYFCGSQFSFSSALPFGSFMYFIPTLFSLMLLRSLYYRCSFHGRVLLLCLSSLCLIGFAYNLSFFFPIWRYSLCSSALACAMLLPGLVCRRILEKVNFQYVHLCFFILVLVMFIVYPLSGYPNAYWTINRIFSIVLVFLFILSLRKVLSKSRVLKVVGRLSFPIFLIHIFIYKGFYFLLDSSNETGLGMGSLIYICVTTISVLIARTRPVKLIFSL